MQPVLCVLLGAFVTAPPTGFAWAGEDAVGRVGRQQALAGDAKLKGSE